MKFHNSIELCELRNALSKIAKDARMDATMEQLDHLRNSDYLVDKLMLVLADPREEKATETFCFTVLDLVDEWTLGGVKPDEYQPLLAELLSSMH